MINWDCDSMINPPEYPECPDCGGGIEDDGNCDNEECDYREPDQDDIDDEKYHAWAEDEMERRYGA